MERLRVAAESQKGSLMSIDRSNVRGLVRSIAYDLKGARLGRVAQVFLDDRSDEPAWVAVDVTRVRGMRLLPLAGAAMKGRHLVIRADRSTVRAAPRIDLGDGQLSSQDESRLLEHYGLASGRHTSSPTGEQRPTSPWPDDTERESAWERPGQWQSDQNHNQTPPAPAPVSPAPIGEGWGRPSSSADHGEVGDRGAMQTPDATVPHQPDAPGRSAPAPSSTAPPASAGPPAEPSTQAPAAPTAPIQLPRAQAAPEPRPDGETTGR